jgi:hypothetical protein
MYTWYFLNKSSNLLPIRNETSYVPHPTIPCLHLSSAGHLNVNSVLHIFSRAFLSLFKTAVMSLFILNLHFEYLNFLCSFSFILKLRFVHVVDVLSILQLLQYSMLLVLLVNQLRDFLLVAILADMHCVLRKPP